MMDNTYESDYDRLLGQLNEEMGCVDRDIEKEIRIMFEDTDMGRQLNIVEWDVVYECDKWWIVADNGSQWAVTETEDVESPFQFDLVEETNESVVNESEIGDLYQQVRDKYGRGDDREYGVDAVSYFMYGNKDDDNIFVKDNAYRTGVLSRAEAEDLHIYASELLLDQEFAISQAIDEGDFNWLDENIYGPIAHEIQSLSGTNESLDEEDMDQDGIEYASVKDRTDVKEEEDKEESDSDSEEENDEPLSDDFLAGGKADDYDVSVFDSEQLRMGQHVELEHTNNPAVALEIAKDHLREDPIYYTKLKRMENGECDHPEDESAYVRIGKEKKKKNES